ncbi:hypothetical protein IMG5_042780, partial [Ichthyophthirius multifiliis]
KNKNINSPYKKMNNRAPQSYLTNNIFGYEEDYEEQQRKKQQNPLVPSNRIYGGYEYNEVQQKAINGYKGENNIYGQVEQKQQPSINRRVPQDNNIFGGYQQQVDDEYSRKKQKLQPMIGDRPAGMSNIQKESFEQNKNLNQQLKVKQLSHNNIFGDQEDENEKQKKDLKLMILMTRFLVDMLINLVWQKKIEFLE